MQEIVIATLNPNSMNPLGGRNDMGGDYFRH